MCRQFSPLVLPTLLLAVSAAVGAQDARAQAAGLGVFLDCNAPNCESSHIRNEIPYADWVRDRADADVHVLVTSEQTGSGGRAYQLTFIGLRAFDGDSTTVHLGVEPSTAAAEARDRLTRRIAQGLVRYLVHTGVADAISVTPAPSIAGAPIPDSPGPANDPWNAWVFSVGLDGSLDGETRETEHEFSLQVEASRVTADWKLEIELEGEYNRNRFELSDGPFTSITRDWGVDGFAAHSVARFWSAGLAVRVGTSTRENQDLRVRVAPAIEYSVFPYSEFSRRQLTVRYSVGANHWDYLEQTLYGMQNEQRWDQALELALELQQRWGSAETRLAGSHFLHDISRYRLEVGGELDIRLFRGLSLDIGAGYARVHDQLYVQAEDDYTDEEILLRLRALQTNYRYQTRIGLRYTFGSIYNSVVNPRLGQGVW
ncbi:MAG TPA: hypothetical protein VMM18_15880 [Gemmatimonadaceae bacterium]|nr:hypothetical protein [Gemmatimonadaceae bacterium]